MYNVDTDIEGMLEEPDTISREYSPDGLEITEGSSVEYHISLRVSVLSCDKSKYHEDVGTLETTLGGP